MTLKTYQAKALDCFEAFLKACKVIDIPTAYKQSIAGHIPAHIEYNPMPKVPEAPYVCLRIPTGGGKTLIAGMAIERINRSLLYTDHSVTLWLVPSDPIREQTLKALRDSTNLLHQTVFSALGDVSVLTIDEALRVRPHVLRGSNVIIVSTMQAFKQADIDRLSVYKQNTDMQAHLEGQSDKAVIGNYSLVDVLRLHHPFIVVDEAHNQGTELAFETLARLEPCAILELTATPDRKLQPSNVLYSVNASALQDEDMIKMPLEVIQRQNWQDTLRDAITCLDGLQKKAEAEQAATGEYLRPIMLLQAERRVGEHETLVPEKVKEALMQDFLILENQIAIATGTVDELSDHKDVLSPSCPVRFIITVDKLREGWDCPFAYVLCSFRNTESATAAEQILGRVLRMPNAKRKTLQELNEGYAFVTSSNFHQTISNLQEGLVKSGFNRQEVSDFIRTPEVQDDAQLSLETRKVIVVTPDLPSAQSLTPALAKQVEIIPEMGSITLEGEFTPRQAKALEELMPTDEGKQALRKGLEQLGSTIFTTPPKSPSEKGEKFSVPLLSIKQGALWEEFEDSHLLQGDWKLIDYTSDLLEAEFSPSLHKAQGARILIEGDKVHTKYLADIESQMALLDHQSSWTREELQWWLDKNVSELSVSPDDKAAFIDRAVSYLLEKRSVTLDALVYNKSRLREAMEAKVRGAKQEAMRQAYQKLLSLPDNFTTNEHCELIFQQGHYGFTFVLPSTTELPKHFFPQIGNLQPKGEEFECALFLATQLEEVKYWVRNVEKQPSSFSLQTSTDKFYPDFVCLLKDGRILAVESKGEPYWSNDDSKEKRRIGELWEKRSNGKCLFVMPRGTDWEEIRKKVQ